MIELLDDDGYPTDEFLEKIKTWDYKDGFDELLEFAMEGHIYPNYWSREKIDGKSVWKISTGGWSGNESIIQALKQNAIFWMVCWVQSRRGGHYIFECKL
jgi:hypothetical protein